MNRKDTLVPTSPACIGWCRFRSRTAKGYISLPGLWAKICYSFALVKFESGYRYILRASIFSRGPPFFVITTSTYAIHARVYTRPGQTIPVTKFLSQASWICIKCRKIPFQFCISFVLVYTIVILFAPDHARCQSLKSSVILESWYLPTPRLHTSVGISKLKSS